jgi:alcohol dehydrogenase (cytochrome c)
MLRRFGRIHVAALVVICSLGAAVAAVVSVAELRWRAAVIVAKLRGDLPEIPTSELFGWLKPASPVYLEGLATQPNPGANIHNILPVTAESLAAGQKNFEAVCSACHGADALGGNGPNLLSHITNATEWSFFSTTKWGREGTAMAAQPLSDAEIWQVHSFLRQRARAWAIEAAGGTSTRARVNVALDRLLAAEDHPEEWLTYSGNMAGFRYSKLNQINRDNIGNLRVAWTAQLRPSTKPLSATPIVSGGLIFVTEAPEGVMALDAKTGRVAWRYSRPIDASKLPLCCGAFNRGVAVLGSRIYVATLDSYLVALDANTGTELWQAKVAEPAEGFSMTSAPLVVEGHVIVGVAGGEYGMRGFLAAFDPETGAKRWHFNVIPGAGEPGNETWAGDSWKTGGAPTWTTGVYDRELDLVLWTTGNPWPPLDASVRRGDNLYSNSIVALDRKTGKMKWYYQFTPADSHDWDAAQQPILTDIRHEGQTIPAVIMANRNAFYYALDRRTGKFLRATSFVKQTWNRGFDKQGRPDADPAALPSASGTLVWPWMHGGTNWWPPSFDPARRLHFVPTVDAATLYFTVDMNYQAGQMTMGGTTRLATNAPAIMAIKALNPDTGETVWSTRLDRGDFHQFARISGLLSTAGNIVVGGFEDRIVILDSDSGKELWRFRPGGLTNAAPVTYMADGMQYVAVIAGNVLFAFSNQALAPEIEATVAAASP